MLNNNLKQIHEELLELCETIREFVNEGKYQICIKNITKAMELYPHAPEPHNLMGIVLEKMGEHPLAMKHFRAAWALDPTYLPVNHNLNTYGTFFSSGKCAYDENDLESEHKIHHEVCMQNGIKCVCHKNKIEYDENGIGHVVRR